MESWELIPNGDRLGKQAEFYPSKWLWISNRRIKKQTKFYKGKRRIPNLLWKETVAEDETMLFVIVHEYMLDLERET